MNSEHVFVTSDLLEVSCRTFQKVKGQNIMSKHVIVLVRCDVFDHENNDNLAKWKRDGHVFVMRRFVGTTLPSGRGTGREEMLVG